MQVIEHFGCISETFFHFTKDHFTKAITDRDTKTISIILKTERSLLIHSFCLQKQLPNHTVSSKVKVIFAHIKQFPAAHLHIVTIAQWAY